MEVIEANHWRLERKGERREEEREREGEGGRGREREREGGGEREGEGEKGRGKRGGVREEREEGRRTISDM